MTKSPEIIAKRVASILKLDEKTLPFLRNLFQKIQPTKKAGSSMLKMGNYTLLIQYPLYHRTSQSYNFTVIALNLVEKTFVSNIDITIKAGPKNELLFSGETNERGWCGVSLILSSELALPLQIIAEDKDTGETDTMNISPTIISQDAFKVNHTHLYLITDKQLYKKGQKLRYIGICWGDFDGYYFPITKKEASKGFTIKLINADNKRLFEHMLEPTSYGIVWGEFPIVENLPEGIYTLRLQYNDNGAYEDMDFEVKQYTTPDIELTTSLDSKWVLKEESEKGFEYPLHVKYFYGDPVQNAVIQLKVENVSFYEKKRGRTRVINLFEPIILYSTRSDEEGNAVIEIKPSEKFIIKEIVERFKFNYDKSDFIKNMENGKSFTLHIILSVRDEQEREIKEEKQIQCIANILKITDKQIEFDSENERIYFKGKIEDQNNKPFSGSIHLRIEDEYKTVQSINRDITINEGKLKVQLIPRVVFGLAPKLSLKGTISYKYHEREMRLEFSMFYGREGELSKAFELLIPEKIEFGAKNAFELTTQTYEGPIWLQYGKDEIFAQVSGYIGGDHGSFRHEITIPKPYVGDIGCMINYFDFKQTMEVKTLKKLIKIPLEKHLLPLKVEFPTKANPGEKVNAKVSRVKEEITPWLLALKLADKSLRGIDAMTEFNLDKIYALTEKLSISSEALWSEDLDNILADLEEMILKVLKQTDYEPNIFIILHQLDTILRTDFEEYRSRPFGTRPAGLMSKYFINLRGNIERLFSFFEELTMENLKLAASNFGNFFFKNRSLTLDFFVRYYFTLIKMNPAEKKYHKLLLDYLNEIFLEKLKTTKKNTNDSYSFLTSMRALPSLDEKDSQIKDQNIAEFIDRLNEFIKKLLEFFGNNKAKFIIPSNITDGLRSMLLKISRVSFAKNLFLERYKYYYRSKKLLPQILNEIPALENVGLIHDIDVLTRFVDIGESMIDNIYWYFDERIEVEKEKEVWRAISEILKIIEGIEEIVLKKRIKRILKFVYSEEFYAKIYGRQYLYVNYPSLEEDIFKINGLSDLTQRKSLIKVILEDLKDNLFNPYKELEPMKLIPQILYNRYYLKRILNLIKWEGLPKDVLDLKSNFLRELEKENYFNGILNALLEHRKLKDLIKISPNAFIDALERWQQRIYGEEEYDFSEIGEFPDKVRINVDVLFEESFGTEPLNIYDIFYGNLAELFLFHLKKADYGIIHQSRSYFYEPKDLTNDYIIMLDFMNRVEQYFEALKSISDNFKGRLSTLTETLETINREHIFKVFYLYFLTEVKKPELFEIGSFYNFHKILKVFQPDPPEQIEFIIEASHRIKDFIFQNNISHLTEAQRDDFLYFIAGHFAYKNNFSEIPPRDGSTVLKDYFYYKEIIKICTMIFTEATVSKEKYRKDLLNELSEMDTFESFWSFLNFKKALIQENYYLNSIIELKSQTASHGEKLLKIIYKNLLHFFLEGFKNDSSLGMVWYTHPRRPQNYKDKWNAVLTAFGDHPLEAQFKNDLELLEYHFIDAGVQIEKYYKGIIDAYNRKDIPFISLREKVWFGIDSYSAYFPNVIGYPKYTSIMTDVEHYRGGRSRRVTTVKKRKPKESEGKEKKVTVRKNFADIGFYKIMPMNNKKSESIEVQLPDSITTQELHVASFNQNCNMNYKISEVKVTQEFFIKDDFPEILNWKDEIEGNIVITNTTHDSLDVSAIIEQFDAQNPQIKDFEEPLEISFQSPTSFTLKPKGMMNVKLMMRAKRCGRFLIKIIFDSDKYRDEVHKILRIQAGFPSDISQTFEFMHPSNGKNEDQKQFTLSIPSKGVDYAYSLSIYPSLTSHILDGIEANLRYPYGCIEQVFSALMPNLVYYDYLASQNRLFGELKNRLEGNIIGGYLKLQSHQKHDGRFGWWGSSKTSVFITAMVLYAYKLLYKHHFLVETYTIKQIVSYLLKEKLNKQTYLWRLPEKKSQERKLSRFTDITLTSYVLSALQEIREIELFESEHEFLFIKAVEKLNAANYENITDCYLLYLLYKHYSVFKQEELPQLIEKIKKYRIKPHWMEGSAIGSDVETTARLTHLLWENKDISETTRNEIIEWIYTQKSPYGGWNTTSDTRAVVELLISMLEDEACDLIMSIECNGNKIIEDTHITMDNLSELSYKLSYIPLNKYLHHNNEGEENQLVITAKGNGAPAIKLIQENWIERKPAPMEDLHITRVCKETRIPRYSNTSITLELNIPSELDEMIVIEEPLIPAANIERSSLDSLIKDGKVIGFKYADNNIAFFLPPGEKERTITYEIVAYKTFHGSQGSATIYPMYEPYKKQHGNITRYAFHTE